MACKRLDWENKSVPSNIISHLPAQLQHTHIVIYTGVHRLVLEWLRQSSCSLGWAGHSIASSLDWLNPVNSVVYNWSGKRKESWSTHNNVSVQDTVCTIRGHPQSTLNVHMNPNPNSPPLCHCTPPHLQRGLGTRLSWMTIVMIVKGTPLWVG